MTGVNKFSLTGWSAIIRYVTGLLLLLMLTGCGLIGGGDGDAPPGDGAAAEAAPESVVQTGTLICNETCAAEGQCGARTDGMPVVLGHSMQPATRDHDLVFPVDAPLIIMNGQTRLVQRVTGEQFSAEFFQVQINESGLSGWVAGWCVNVDQ